MNQLRDILLSPLCGDTENIAIIDPEKASIKYVDLSLQVDALTITLKQLNLGAGDTVGIYLPKSIPCVISILGVLGAGAAYVPIDAHGSLSRNRLILRDSRVSAIVVEKSLAMELSAQLACNIDFLDLIDLDLILLVCHWEDKSSIHFVNDLAMILYTSGSTGTPKGVQITHNNAMTFINWATNTFSVVANDICASIAPFHFDLSLFDLYVSLSQGATILLLDQKTTQNTLMLSSYLDKYRVSICYTTPTVLKMLLNYGRLQRYDHSSLKLVLFAGEVFPVKPLTQLRQYWSQSKFYNLYGPTESNVITYHSLPALSDESQDSPTPIGLPCEHALCKILVDGDLLDICVGVEGELLVSGASVTPGYLGDEEKNSQVFLHCADGERYYRTGDFVQVTEEGFLQFIMRKDRMVKRRGYRIELDEIESILAFHESASEVAVCTQADSEETIIVAFFCQNSGQKVIDSTELKQFCLQHLPGYFLPNQFIFPESLPKTSSGKIDYQTLQELAS